MFCHQCGQSLPDDSTFCFNCGTKMDGAAEPEAAPQQAAPSYSQPEAPAKKALQLPKKTLLLIAAGVVAIILLVVIISSLFGGGGGKSETPLLYVKEAGLVYTENHAKPEPLVVDDELLSKDLLEEYDMDVEAAYDMLPMILTSENGEIAYYLGDYDDGEFTLFRADLTDVGGKNFATEKIASDVSSSSGYPTAGRVGSVNRAVKITLDGKSVFFIKGYESGEGGKLNIWKDGESEQIAKDVVGFDITDDGKRVIYRTVDEKDGEYEYTLYLLEVGGKDEAVKIAKDVYAVSKTSEDLTTVYYQVEDAEDETYTIYKAVCSKGEAESEKLASDTASAYGYSGLLGSITDDGKFFYTEYDEEDDVLTLYFFNGEESVKITDEYSYNCLVSAKNGVCVFYYDESYSYGWSASDSDDDDEPEFGYYISFDGGEPVELDCEAIYSASISSDGKTLYVSEADDEDAEEDEYVLCKYDLKDGAAENREEIAEECTEFTYVNDTLYYFTDVDDDRCGTMYAYIKGEGVKVSSDAYSLVIAEPDGDRVCFFSDIDDDELPEATLHIWDGKETVKVADDVFAIGWNFYKDGILYLSDMDEDDGGDLFFWKNGDKTKVDSEVQAILPCRTMYNMF